MKMIRIFSIFSIVLLAFAFLNVSASTVKAETSKVNICNSVAPFTPDVSVSFNMVENINFNTFNDTVCIDIRYVENAFISESPPLNQAPSVYYSNLNILNKPDILKQGESLFWKKQIVKLEGL